MNPVELKSRTKRFALRIIKMSRAIPKIGIVAEESDETALWLELLAESGIMPAKKLSALLEAANELTAIMAASRKTASGK